LNDFGEARFLLLDLVSGTDAGDELRMKTDETRPRWSAYGEQIVYSSMAGSDQTALRVCDIRESHA